MFLIFRKSQLDLFSEKVPVKGSTRRSKTSGRVTLVLPHTAVRRKKPTMTDQKKAAFLEVAKKDNAALYEATLKQIRKKRKPMTMTNIYATYLTKVNASKSWHDETARSKIKLWTPTDGRIKRILEGKGFHSVHVSIGQGYDERGSYSEYFELPGSKVTARLSDHEPVQLRSTGRTLSFYPGSHASDEEAMDAIDTAVRRKKKVEAQPLDNATQRSYTKVESEVVNHTNKGVGKMENAEVAPVVTEFQPKSTGDLVELFANWSVDARSANYVSVARANKLVDELRQRDKVEVQLAIEEINQYGNKSDRHRMGRLLSDLQVVNHSNKGVGEMETTKEETMAEYSLRKQREGRAARRAELEKLSSSSEGKPTSAKGPQPTRTYLNVSYTQKDNAKQHGAKWDSSMKRWYYPGGELPKGLEQYMPQTVKVIAHDGRVLTKEHTRCRKCGTTGWTGSYPFSTLGAGICDDCV